MRELLNRNMVDTPGTRKRESISPIRFLAFNAIIGSVCLVILCYQLIFLRSVPLALPVTTSNAYDNADPELVWQTVPISLIDDLVWIPCYHKLQCAKLQVPLHYAIPETGNATIAMAKVPSKIHRSSPNYRGPILFNPGGPGVSGVGTIIKDGELFQTIVGDDYDLIGFDPRGIGRTQPIMTIFPDEAQGTRFRILVDALPLVNTTQDAVAREYAQYVLYGNLASARTMHVAPFISTALVCRDMLSIVRAHGREKLQYWGFSYGTVLGATFAAMFPDHIERMILDGVVDSYNYYASLWSNGLADADKVLEWYLRDCVAAGPRLCAFHESSLEKIQQRYTTLLSSLKARPIAVPASSSSATAIDYGVVDYSLVLKTVSAFLYRPYASHSRTVTPTGLANALVAAEKGDGLPLWELAKNRTEYFKCDCVNGPDPVPHLAAIDAMLGVLCSDGDEVHDSLEQLRALYDEMAAVSSFAPLWGARLRCAGWKVRSVERYSGPFTGNTSFPILLIGNKADPVTPLRSAHIMSKGFNGSVVLTQNSAGHCSLAATSQCTAKAVRAYFRDGTLPEPGTICEVQSKIFPGDEDTLHQDRLETSAEDRAVIDAWKGLSDAFHPSHFGLL